MKPKSLMRRIDAFWTARPDEGLSLTDACAKFGCTAEQFARAVDKANRILGLGMASEPMFRLGPRVGARRKRKSGNLPPIRPSASSSSIFSGHAQRVRVGASSEPPPPTVVERDGVDVRVTRITPQETDEWKQREAARRAAQFIPKPKKSARTRSAKLVELIGEAASDLDA